MLKCCHLEQVFQAGFQVNSVCGRPHTCWHKYIKKMVFDTQMFEHMHVALKWHEDDSTANVFNDFQESTALISYIH